MTITQILPWALLAVVIVVIAFVVGRRSKRTTTITASIESIKMVGELVVLRSVIKEVGDKVIKTSWYKSNGHLTQLYTFEAEYYYDLRSSDFRISYLDAAKCKMTMPRMNLLVCLKEAPHTIRRDIPKLGGVFNGTMSEDEENQLGRELFEQAVTQARGSLVASMEAAQVSAQNTLKKMAKDLGVDQVEFEFRDNGVVPQLVESLQRAGSRAAAFVDATR